MLIGAGCPRATTKEVCFDAHIDYSKSIGNGYNHYEAWANTHKRLYEVNVYNKVTGGQKIKQNNNT